MERLGYSCQGNCHGKLSGRLHASLLRADAGPGRGVFRKSEGFSPRYTHPLLYQEGFTYSARQKIEGVCTALVPHGRYPSGRHYTHLFTGARTQQLQLLCRKTFLSLGRQPTQEPWPKGQDGDDVPTGHRSKWDSTHLSSLQKSPASNNLGPACKKRQATQTIKQLHCNLRKKLWPATCP